MLCCSEFDDARLSMWGLAPTARPDSARLSKPCATGISLRVQCARGWKLARHSPSYWLPAKTYRGPASNYAGLRPAKAARMMALCAGLTLALFILAGAHARSEVLAVRTIGLTVSDLDPHRAFLPRHARFPHRRAKASAGPGIGRPVRFANRGDGRADDAARPSGGRVHPI